MRWITDRAEVSTCSGFPMALDAVCDRTLSTSFLSGTLLTGRSNHDLDADILDLHHAQLQECHRHKNVTQKCA